MKKVLILTTSTGDGHNQAADSLLNVFANHDYLPIKYDFLDSSSRLWNTFVVKGYKLLASKFPKTYGNLYRLSNLNCFNKIIPNILISRIEKGVLNEISRLKPDIIVGTHAFSVTVISKLKKRNLINIPFISIVTDFKVHGAYIDETVDAYITASHYTKFNMIMRNIPKHKIYTYGIPIRKEFLSNYRVSNQNKTNCFNILLMGGGMGLKFIAPVLKKLSENRHNLSIVVVCGSNKKLQQALEKKYKKEIDNKVIHILGFTKDIPDLMQNAQIIITKPGGLTASEAIVKELPMLLPYAIPGQEEENKIFLSRMGAAIDISTLDSFNNVLDKLIENPGNLEIMRKNMRRICKDYSVQHIVELSNRFIKNNREQELFKKAL